MQANYTLIEYKVTFVADGVTVAEVPFTVETKEITPPAVPEKAGYTGAWEPCTIGAGDVTVNAVYTRQYLYGDLDFDGNVTAADARIALRIAVKLEQPQDEIGFTAADIDKDGQITAVDARLILRRAVWLEQFDPAAFTWPEPAEAAPAENEDRDG